MSDPSRARVSGPLESYAQGFVAELLGAGYRPVSASFQLQLMGHLSRWMQASEVEPGALSGEELERFLAARRAPGRRSTRPQPRQRPAASRPDRQDPLSEAAHARDGLRPRLSGLGLSPTRASHQQGGGAAHQEVSPELHAARVTPLHTT